MYTVTFDHDYITLHTPEGQTLRQSLLWYPALREATDEERAAYTVSLDGLHWRALDTNISLESFHYDDAEPTPLQRFFLTHTELNIAAFAKRIGLQASRLRAYIQGIKKPTPELEAHIMREIGVLGREYTYAACAV